MKNVFSLYVSLAVYKLNLVTFLVFPAFGRFYNFYRSFLRVYSIEFRRLNKKLIAFLGCLWYILPVPISIISSLWDSYIQTIIQSPNYLGLFDNNQQILP